jgi:two-component system chemotaxis sensor kinase CheA
MSVDLSQFHQVFFEESLEGLDIMESALLDMDVQHIDSETINRIFRAAHSIKGGSGTFGFSAIADFTHVVETLLDLIRSDKFVMQAEHKNLFLQSVDCIRTMIQELEQGQTCDSALANELKARFTAYLEASESDSENVPVNESNKGSDSSNQMAESDSKIWHIYFKPSADILRTGNDPVRMFRELADLGEISVTAHLDGLPELSSLDSEACFLAWDIELRGEIERQQIDEVFEWVVDESELNISELSDAGSAERDIPVADPSVVSDKTVGMTPDIDQADSQALPAAESPSQVAALKVSGPQKTPKLNLLQSA